MIRQPLYYPSYAQQSTQPTKKKGSNTQSMRAGDWVCPQCGNLNFSFRNECNRCQNSQKKSSKKPLKKLKGRKPFWDITNVIDKPSRNTGFEHQLLLTPMKDFKVFQKDIPIGKFCNNYLEEYDKHTLLFEEVSEFSLEEKGDCQQMIDQGIAYSIMLLGIDDI